MATTIVGTLSGCDCDVCPECGDCDECTGTKKCFREWHVQYDCETQTPGTPYVFVSSCKEGDTSENWVKIDDSEGICEYRKYENTGTCCESEGDCGGETEIPETPALPDFEDCECAPPEEHTCARCCSCCIDSRARVKIVYDLSSTSWIMYDPENSDPEPHYVPYDASYYSVDCDTPSNPLTCYFTDVPFESVTAYASYYPSGLDGNDCGYWVSNKNDAMHVGSQVFDNQPEMGIQTKLENYVGFTAKLSGPGGSQPCSWFIEVAHMFQVFYRPMNENPDEPWVLSEDHENENSLGFGFNALVFSTSMSEICNDWPVESIGTGAGPSVQGFPDGDFDAPIVSLVPNECCLLDDEGDGTCVEGTPTAQGYCEDPNPLP
jgi:hypothetical protein